MRLRPALLWCGAALLISVLPAGSVAQNNPRVLPVRRRLQQQRAQLPEILKRVISAAANLRLFGERVVDQRVQGQLVRHAEIVLRQGTRTRIEFSSDSRFYGQIIVDDGSTRRRWTPKNRTITEQPSAGDDTLSRLVDRNRKVLNPRVQLSDGGLVAGIQTTKASFLRNDGSVVQEFFIDPASGAVLKRVGYDNKTQAIVAYFEFTSVHYNPSIGSNAWNLPSSPHPIVTPEFTLLKNARKTDLPAIVLHAGQGFRLSNSRVLTKDGVSVLQEIYLGPTGRLSLFILRHDVDPRKLEDNARRNTNSFVAQVSGVSVVLVGPYPGTRLVRLSDTLVTL